MGELGVIVVVEEVGLSLEAELYVLGHVEVEVDAHTACHAYLGAVPDVAENVLAADSGLEHIVDLHSLAVVPGDIGAYTGEYAEAHETVGVKAADEVGDVECHVEHRGDVVPLPVVVLVEAEGRFRAPGIGCKTQTYHLIEVVAHGNLCVGSHQLAKRGLAESFLEAELSLYVPVGTIYGLRLLDHYRFLG